MATNFGIGTLARRRDLPLYILSLLAQAYEQKPEIARARELYAKILGMPDHSLQAAFARPLAARRLAAR